MKTCPDCLGKKVIQLLSSSVPCELCQQTGSVAEPADACQGSALDFGHMADTDPLVVTPPQVSNSDFDDGFCLLSVLDGEIYQINPKTSDFRCLGKELICTLDGYSRREEWADLAFYYQRTGPRSIARLEGTSQQNTACLLALYGEGMKRWRVYPFQVRDRWETSVRSVPALQSDFYDASLGQSYKIGKTASLAELAKRYGRNVPLATCEEIAQAIRRELKRNQPDIKTTESA